MGKYDQSPRRLDDSSFANEVASFSPARTSAVQAQSPKQRNNEALRVLKASYYFLQRKQARRAWFFFVAAVAFASLPWTAGWHEVREGAIVLASLAAGAIFLPELNSGLWQLNAREIRDTVPEHRRHAFYVELIRADCPDDAWAQRWATIVWQSGILPLLDEARQKRRIRWDMRYEASVYLNRDVEIAGQFQTMTRVETSIDNERALPSTPDGMAWVSVCGNEESLRSEFKDDGCLLREIVDLPSLDKATWATEVRRQCYVAVQIGERTIRFGADNIIDVRKGDLRIVRWMVPIGADESNRVPVSCRIELHFPITASTTHFPIMFSEYYCAGKTLATFRLYHGSGPRPVLHCRHSQVIRGRPLTGAKMPELASSSGDGQADGDSVYAQRFDTAEQQSITYMTPTPPDSLLWPGFSINCWWEFIAAP